MEYQGIKMKAVPNWENYYVTSNGDVWSFKRKNPIKLTPNKNKRGYLVVGLTVNCKEKKYKVHQIVAMAFLNHTPNGNNLVVDHIDNNKMNNHYSNLNVVKQRFNATKNTRGGHNGKPTSKYLGVSWISREGKWNARISINGKYVCLGRFDNELDARDAYINKYKETYNEQVSAR